MVHAQTDDVLVTADCVQLGPADELVVLDLQESELRQVRYGLGDEMNFVFRNIDFD